MLWGGAWGSTISCIGHRLTIFGHRTSLIRLIREINCELELTVNIQRILLRQHRQRDPAVVHHVLQGAVVNDAAAGALVGPGTTRDSLPFGAAAKCQREADAHGFPRGEQGFEDSRLALRARDARAPWKHLRSSCPVDGATGR